MNAQLSLIANRQFWTGAAATFVVGFLVAIGVPNLMRTHMSTSESKRNFAMRAQVQGMDMLAPAETDADRKMVRTASTDLLVKSPKEVSEKIRMLALQAGGFLISSETYGGENASSASLTIRVPVDRFDQIRAQISKLGLRVESEKLEAQDVTKQYVDLSARFRNFRAQEAQYLGILRQAKTVKDTVDVSGKLNEVRALQASSNGCCDDYLTCRVGGAGVWSSLAAVVPTETRSQGWYRRYWRLRFCNGLVRFLCSGNPSVAGNDCGRRCGRMAHLALVLAGVVCSTED